MSGNLRGAAAAEIADCGVIDELVGKLTGLWQAMDRVITVNGPAE